MKGLKQHEQIVLMRRKHILILISELFGIILIAFLPFALYALFGGTAIVIGGETIVLNLQPAALTFIGSLWLFIFWMKIAGIWTDYFLDIWIVTNKRIIDREQKGLFHRQVSTINLNRIQDITIETKGVLATLFHFGDIHVQSAGEAREFVMRGISNPKHVREIIRKTHDKAKEHEKRIHIST